MKSKNIEIFVYPAVTSGELEIDQAGRIWRVGKKGWDRWNHCVRLNKCKKVRAENDIGGYFQIRVMFDKIRYGALAHRLVWMHFFGVIPPELTVNHKNGQKKDNRPENLELATYREQQLHALHVLKVGRTDQRGEKNAMAKLSDVQVAEIRQRRLGGEPLLSIAKDYGVSFQAISKITLHQRR